MSGEHITAFSFGAVRIDWLKPVLPLYTRALADAQPLEWSEGHSIRVATAEGLILTKMVAFRPQDQVDIETLLTANRDDIDVDLDPRGMVPLRGDGGGAHVLAGGRHRQAGRPPGVNPGPSGRFGTGCEAEGWPIEDSDAADRHPEDGPKKRTPGRSGTRPTFGPGLEGADAAPSHPEAGTRPRPNPSKGRGQSEAE